MTIFYAFLAGLLFGIGLIVSDMVSPSKVLAFLDVAGKWDPSLAVVAAAAVAVGVIAYAVARKRTDTLLGTPMRLPQATAIDPRLALGSLVFGIGWGLAGFGPGPALAALGTGHVKAFLFVVAMIAGMGIYEFAEYKRAQKARSALASEHHAHEHHRAGGKHKGRRH
ncbi:MAG: YeeE/YedE family protein [Betaproteobacteria bacterium]|nr:YeeE/YedE family protein [Betaproteobacteria bacterium]MBK9607915.1 YeeE/YedE family protein [Betaproteobacteria bacterium]